MTHQLTKRVEPACSAPQTQETGGEAANKGGKSGGQSEKSKCALETDSRLTPAGTSISTPLTPASVRSARAEACGAAAFPREVSVCFVYFILNGFFIS